MGRMSPEQDAPLCVLCRKHPVAAKWRPFCSERCQRQDLARWADGTYRVAAEPVHPAADGDDTTDNPEA
jgi:endogenous inhibitor of DNA gyrase (YacG/DUF329 family)